MSETCAICGCLVHRDGDYAKPTIEGRSHATRHHYVAERFFGRSQNRPGEQRYKIFEECPWGVEGETGVFCYECHEELLHNPVFLPKDVDAFSKLVKAKGLNEGEKPENREKLAGRIKLFHDVLACGLEQMMSRKEDDV